MNESILETIEQIREFLAGTSAVAFSIPADESTPRAFVATVITRMGSGLRLDPVPCAFWKYLRNAFDRDAGLRIDHFLLTPSLAARLTGAGVDRDVRAREKASDHAPVWITLAD